MSTHGDGGKGSGRRNEDVSKVKSNWDLIDWSVKTSKKGTTMDNYDDVEDFDSEEQDDSEYEICHVCRGSGEGMYDGSTCYHCKGTGEEPYAKDCDYDDI